MERHEELRQVANIVEKLASIEGMKVTYANYEICGDSLFLRLDLAGRMIHITIKVGENSSGDPALSITFNDFATSPSTITEMRVKSE